MAEFFPEAVRDIALNRANENGSINVPPPPDFNTPSMQGSLQQALSENLGEFVVVEFLIGTQTLMQKSGILYAVGNSVMTLYEELTQTFVICDIFSVKFVTFYLPGQRPQRYANAYDGVSPYASSAFGPAIPGPAGGVTLSGLPNMSGMNAMGGAGNGMYMNSMNNMNGMNNRNGIPGMR